MLTNCALLIVAFNRPDHVRNLVESLDGNPEFDSLPLILALDGPRRETDERLISRVKEIVLTRRPDVHLIERSENFGVRRAIETAITSVLGEFERVIVVEDDLEVSPYFLKFMLDGLETFHSTENVASIHGYSIDMPKTVDSTYFLRGADCWGWATWRRAWKIYDSNAQTLYEELLNQGHGSHFSFGGTSPHLDLVKQSITGEIDSWAIRWHASTYLAGHFSLHPRRSLVRNLGMDGSGTHAGKTEIYNSQLSDAPVSVELRPVSESQPAFLAYKKFYSSRNRTKKLKSVKGKVVDAVDKIARTVGFLKAMSSSRRPKGRC